MKRQSGTNRNGFTLAELLVVVAIIAILVAVSIPIFTGKLEETREATDVANMRAAKAAAAEALLSGDFDDNVWQNGSADGDIYHVAVYDAEKGAFVKFYSGSGYGKGTESDGKMHYATYDSTLDYMDARIQVQVDEFGGGEELITLIWYDKDNEPIGDY